MRKISIIGLSVLIACSISYTAYACNKEYKSTSINFSGEVHAGEKFKKEITTNSNNHIYFFLTPNDHGWTFSIGPDTEIDYIYPFNPPYRFNELQYLDGSYGQKTLKYDVREFYFSVNESDTDKKIITSVLNRILWAKNDADQEDGMKNLEAFKKGHGVLTILSGDSHPPAANEDDQTETVTRLKFHVDMTVPVLSTNCSTPSQ